MIRSKGSERRGGSMARWALHVAMAGACVAFALVVPAGVAAATPVGEPAAKPDAGELSRSIFSELPYHGNAIGAKIASTRVDPASGRVVVSVENYSDGLAAALRERYGKDRVEIRQGIIARYAVLHEPAATARVNLAAGRGPDLEPQDNVGACIGGIYCTPTRGGVLLQQTRSDGTWSCSSTIVGLAASGQNATLTAGHCFHHGIPVYAGQSSPDVGGYQLGNVGNRYFADYSDAEDIRWLRANGNGGDTLTNCVWTPSQNCLRMTSGGTTSDYGVSSSIQKIGQTTGLTSGTITGSSVNINIEDENGIVTPFVDQVEGAICVRHGDSGGPFYRGSMLLGITSAVGGLDNNGNCTSATRAYFTKIFRAVSPSTGISFSPRYTP